MNLLCFGIAKEIMGSADYKVDDATITTVKQLKEFLMKTYPEFDHYKAFQVAVNQEFAEDTTALSSSDEIAIIPPVSGG